MAEIRRGDQWCVRGYDSGRFGGMAAKSMDGSICDLAAKFMDGSSITTNRKSLTHCEKGMKDCYGEKAVFRCERK